jgi:hypothetical protein
MCHFDSTKLTRSTQHQEPESKFSVKLVKWEEGTKWDGSVSDGSYLKWANLPTFEETQSLTPSWFCLHIVVSWEHRKNVLAILSRAWRYICHPANVTSRHVTSRQAVFRPHTNQNEVVLDPSMKGSLSSTWECFSFSGMCFGVDHGDYVRRRWSMKANVKAKSLHTSWRHIAEWRFTSSHS